MPPNTKDNDNDVADAVASAAVPIIDTPAAATPAAETVLVRDHHGDDRTTYVRCDSSAPFELPPELPPSDAAQSSKSRSRSAVKPAYTRRLSASEVNETLNLNLGLPINPDSPPIRRLFRLLSSIFAIFEDGIFALIERLPLQLKQRITQLAWSIYLPLHKLILGRRTGIHPDASPEYHALSTVMHWGRLFPVSIGRMRFSLSQLGVTHPPGAYPYCLRRFERDGNGDGSRKRRTEQRQKAVVKEIEYDMKDTCKLAGGITEGDDTKEGGSTTTTSTPSTVVTGYYIQHNPAQPSSKVLFWLYGGAYLAGDAKGNLPIAEKFGQWCDGMDGFVPTYRLLPEYTFFDSLRDVVQAYEYLVVVRGVDPSNVTCLGISSGGGLVVRLLQLLAERRREMGIDDATNSSSTNSNGSQDDVPKSAARLELERLLTNPAGGVLMSPFVDYTVESCTQPGSFTQYIKHDLIVNQSVIEEGLQYFDQLGDAKVRRRESPVYRSFEGLPPLCLVVSEHEACFDQNRLLVDRARADGVTVTCGAWKYMCHVWPLLSMFIPEGRQACDFMVNWIKENCL